MRQAGFFCCRQIACDSHLSPVFRHGTQLFALVGLGLYETKRMKSTDKKPKALTYSPRQFAKLLGVSVDTIYRMRDDGELPPELPIQKRVTRWKIEDIGLWFDLDCPNAKNFVRLKRDYQRFTRKRLNRPTQGRGEQK